MRTPIRLLAAPVAIALLLTAACTSSTDGSGAAGRTVSSPGVPSVSSPAAKTVTVTRTSAPATATDPAASSGSAASSTARSGSTSASGPSIRPVPARPLRVATAVSPDKRTTYTIKIWAQDEVTDCAANAYGTPVINYLRTHGCTRIARLLATTTVGGKAVGFAQSGVAFKGATVDQSYQDAGGFRTLVTRDGTGNINDLFREGYRLPSGPTSVPSPDAFCALAQDNTASVTDAWYLDGPTPENDPALVKMAQDIYLQF